MVRLVDSDLLGQHEGLVLNDDEVVECDDVVLVLRRELLLAPGVGGSVPSHGKAFCEVAISWELRRTPTNVDGRVADGGFRAVAVTEVEDLRGPLRNQRMSLLALIKLVAENSPAVGLTHHRCFSCFTMLYASLEYEGDEGND